MNWILASILMFVSSAVMYTLIRKGQKLGISTTVNSLALFVIPVPMFWLYAEVTHSSLEVTPTQLLILFLTALFFSWLGNLFSLKSIEQAPNPGYSLIISKSYVVFTVLASIFLFNSELSWKSAGAIALIVIFSAVIILADKRKTQLVRSYHWLWLAFGAFFCWGGLALVSKYLLNQGVTVAARLFYAFLFVSLILIVEFKVRKEKITFQRSNLWLLLAIGTLGMLFNLFMQLGFQYGPNPGYINAVNAASIMPVALLSAYFFQDELNKKKLLGIIGATIGLILLFL